MSLIENEKKDSLLSITNKTKLNRCDTVGCKINLHPNATTKDSLSHTSLHSKESYDNLSLGDIDII